MASLSQICCGSLHKAQRKDTSQPRGVLEGAPLESGRKWTQKEPIPSQESFGWGGDLQVAWKEDVSLEWKVHEESVWDISLLPSCFRWKLTWPEPDWLCEHFQSLSTVMWQGKTYGARDCPQNYFKWPTDRIINYIDSLDKQLLPSLPSFPSSFLPSSSFSPSFPLWFYQEESLCLVLVCCDKQNNGPQRCPRLWICYLAWQQGLCRYD